MEWPPRLIASMNIRLPVLAKPFMAPSRTRGCEAARCVAAAAPRASNKDLASRMDAARASGA